MKYFARFAFVFLLISAFFQTGVSALTVPETVVVSGIDEIRTQNISDSSSGIITGYGLFLPIKNPPDIEVPENGDSSQQVTNIPQTGDMLESIIVYIFPVSVILVFLYLLKRKTKIHKF